MPAVSEILAFQDLAGFGMKTFLGCDEKWAVARIVVVIAVEGRIV